MSEQEKKISGQPDANLADETRPIPSQAEGDLQTIEEDLEEKSSSAPSSKKEQSAGKS